MNWRTKSGKELILTRAGVNAMLPLIRKDSEALIISKELWGIYTPSTGQSAALLLGPEEICKEALKEYV